VEPEISTKVYRDPASNKMTIGATFTEQATRYLDVAIFDRIAELIAERYVAENYADIVKHLDQQAIATMAMANASAKISKVLEKEVEKEVRTVVETKREVYQRGILGGMERIY
jgi:hypothetical protein